MDDDALALEMQRRATAFVNAAEGQSFRLDYSPDSIEIVELIIEDLFVEPGAERPHESFLATIPPLVGAYVGEIFVRTLDGRWSIHPEHGEGVQLQNGAWVFPTSKAAKRFTNGKEDNLVFYANVVREEIA